jgi:tetratricopeptide (TPR) repeat protein
VTRVARRAVLILAAAAMAACAPKPPKTVAAGAPSFPDYPPLEIPANLVVAPDILDRHQLAWQQLQAGDLRNANRTFNDTLRRSNTFYPAETGLGFVALAGKDYKQAASRFSSALGKNDRYLPAWLGQVDAQLGLGHDTEAIAAIERVLELDPKRDTLRSRLELLRFKEVQTLIGSAQRARQAGRLDEAQGMLERALPLSPSSAVILRELAAVELARDSLDPAEEHVRRAIELDANDAEAHAVLGAILEKRERFRDAAAAYSRAAAIDPRPVWKERTAALREKANAAAIPAEFRDLPNATSVSRAQVAALIGTRLETLIDRAPKRAAAVATDVRNHWAEPWILPVTQAGIMEIQPNHTFQPASTVRRADLARVLTQLLSLVAADRQIDLARWKAARPKFADLPASNLFYNAAALAVTSGAMDTRQGDRFLPTQPVSGAELVAAIDRIEQLAGR